MPNTTPTSGGMMFWKWLTTFLAGLLIAGVPMFLTLSGKVDASQVRDMIQTESPYGQDKQLIFFKLDQIQNTLEKQAQLEAQQAQVWHDVLCLAETEVATDPGITLVDKEKTLLFYDRALLLAHAHPCKGVRLR